MKKFLLLGGLPLFFATLLSAQPADYAEFINQTGIGSSVNDAGEHIQIDPAGNRVVFGFFSETADFNPGGDPFELDPLGSPDLFLASYNPQGELNWAFNLGRLALSNGMDAEGLAIDGEGNILISGSFSNTVDFDPSENFVNQMSTGGKDAFVAKYNSFGELIWVKTFGTPVFELATAVAVDSNNDVILGLRIFQETDVDPGEEETLISVTGGADAVLIKLDSDGIYQWSQVIAPGGNNEEITALAATSNGSIAVAAHTNGITSGIPEQSIWIGAYQGDGTEIWSYDFENQGQSNRISNLAFSADESAVYLGGRIQVDTDFDPSENEFVLQPLFADPFISKHNLSNGSLLWAKIVQSPSTDDFCSGIYESNGLTFIVGSFDVSAIFIPGDFSTQITSAGLSDLFVAAYESEAGAFQNAVSFGGEGNEFVRSGIFTSDGQLAVTGSFSESLNLEPDGSPVSSQGLSDIFLANFTYFYNLSSGLVLSKDAVQLYPVPARDFLRIDFADAVPSNIQIFNVVGQSVHKITRPHPSTSVKLDVSRLNPGVYIIEIQSGGKKISKRFVKQ